MAWGVFLCMAFLGADDGQAAPSEELPDPFLMNDGTRVTSPEEWRGRRDEIVELLLDIEYGHVPPSPGNVAVFHAFDPAIENDGATELRRVRLEMGPDGALKMDVRLYVPRGAAGPFPTILRVGIGGDYAREINARGYILACYEQHDLQPDPGDGRDVAGPARLAYPECDWGSIGVWAWGASRALDYLLTVPEVNPDQVIVTGHSRGGKTALLAGALDERFAMVVPNGSGCGGAGSFRIQGPASETLQSITLPERWKVWFQADFGRFGGKEERLPFDQHFARALVAPRLMLSTDGLADVWANPLGTQAMYLAAQPVFDFLDAGGHNALHFRKGGHDQLIEDFEALMDFADEHLLGKPAARKFNALPFPDKKPSFHWQAPAK
ncbi:MAG: hypothetical protein QG656_197 [Candidatus Hydrogenedentes bacterium]|nr:hypothetical protein [Candidatus Hydrogenedentota bacterium]